MSGPPLERAPTGIPGLDTVLNGGVFQAGITIVQGQPGAGKTILGNQMCFSHARAGGRAVYVTLLAENHSRMLQHLHSLDFFDPSLIPGGVFYVSAFNTLEADGLRGLLRLLWEEVRRHEATLLVLDGLVTVELQADGEIAFKKFVHELQAQAVLAGCSMVLLTSASGGEDLPPSSEHTMVDSVIEVRSRLYGWRAERDLEVLKRRGAGFLRGRHAFRITGAGLEVFPRFEALLAAAHELGPDVPPDPARVSSGLPELDAMLHGGIPSGSTTLLAGAPGAGKTTLALHFLGGDGAPGVLLSSTESPAVLKAKAAALGLPAHGLIGAGQAGIVWSHGTAGLLDEVAGRLLREVERLGARRLVLDGILGLVRLAPDPERVLHILSALRLEMRVRGVTTLLTAEQDILGLSPPGMPDFSALPENLIAMRVLDGPAGLVRTLQVRKARGTAVDTRPRVFELGAGGLVIAPPDAPGATSR